MKYDSSFAYLLNAPEFFLHHDFIDKLWGDWQREKFLLQIHHYHNNITVMPGTVIEMYMISNISPNW